VCSSRAEEGCAHSEAEGGKRAGSFRSLTPLYRRYPLWPPPQPTRSGGLCPCGSRQAPLEEKERRLASEGTALAHFFTAMPNPPSPAEQQWATGTESAERREHRAASLAPPPGVGGVGTRFLRTGCTVLWQLSQNLLESEFTIPRPFPFAFHGGTVAAPVAGNTYRQVAEKGELSEKAWYSRSTSTPVLDSIHGPRHWCPNSACRNRAKALLIVTKSSLAHVEHLHTFAYGHSHYGPVHHRRRFQRRF